jgi:hypothetical protein
MVVVAATGWSTVGTWLLYTAALVGVLTMIGIVVHSLRPDDSRRVAAPPPPVAKPEPAYGFPVVPKAVLPIEDRVGPGRFRVTGVVRETGTDIRIDVEAMSVANAQAKAELKGIVVTEVERK